MSDSTTSDEPTVEYRSDEPLIFDMDGVLLRGRGTDPAIYEAATDRVLAAFDLEPSPAQCDVLRSVRCDEAVESICAELGIECEEFWRAKEHYASEIANDELRRGDRRLYDDVSALETLRRYRPLALVSNNRHETVSFVVEEFGLADLFEVARGRDPTPEGFRRRKPDPFYLQETLETLDADGGIYVGDREKDIRAATRAGLEGVFVRREFNRDEAPDPEPMADVTSLTELTGLVLARDNVV